MAITETGYNYPLVVFCSFAQREGISGVKALRMFRQAGGTIADSVFYDHFRFAGELPKMFGMDGIEYAAKIAVRGQD